MLLVAPALSILLYFLAKTGSRVRGRKNKNILISTNWTPTSTNIPIEEIGTSLIVEVARVRGRENIFTQVGSLLDYYWINDILG